MLTRHDAFQVSKASFLLPALPLSRKAHEATQATLQAAALKELVRAGFTVTSADVRVCYKGEQGREGEQIVMNSSPLLGQNPNPKGKK